MEDVIAWQLLCRRRLHLLSEKITIVWIPSWWDAPIISIYTCKLCRHCRCFWAPPRWRQGSTCSCCWSPCAIKWRRWRPSWRPASWGTLGGRRTAATCRCGSWCRWIRRTKPPWRKFSLVRRQLPRRSYHFNYLHKADGELGVQHEHRLVLPRVLAVKVDAVEHVFRHRVRNDGELKIDNLRMIQHLENIEKHNKSLPRQSAAICRGNCYKEAKREQNISSSWASKRREQWPYRRAGNTGHGLRGLN